MENQAKENPVFPKVAVIGFGTLGVQIALIAAYYGARVKAFDPDEKAFARVIATIQQRIANSGRKTLPPFEDMKEDARKVRLCASLEEADRKRQRLNYSHVRTARMPSSA